MIVEPIVCWEVKKKEKKAICSNSVFQSKRNLLIVVVFDLDATQNFFTHYGKYIKMSSDAISTYMEDLHIKVEKFALFFNLSRQL